MRSLLTFLAFVVPLGAATVYLDSTATGSNNGTSLGNAYTNIDTATAALSAGGDTLKIYGGGSGQVRYYHPHTLGGAYPIYCPKAGGAGNPNTYQIHEDGGTVYFVGDTAAGANNYFFGFQTGVSNVVFNGLVAGDTTPRFVLTNYITVGVGQSYVNVTIIGFKNESVMTGGGMDFNPASGVEVGYVDFTLFHSSADHFSYGVFSGTNSLHHSRIRVAKGTGGLGTDILQWNGVGVAVTNNLFQAYSTNYTGGQHQDGWQCTGNSYGFTFGKNRWEDIANYSEYGDAIHGGFTNLFFYDEVFDGCGAGVVVGVDGGGDNNMIFTNILVANCTIDSKTNNATQPITIGNITGNSATFADVFVENNVAIGGPATPFYFPNTGGGVTTNANYYLSTSQAATNFVNYGGQDYSLLPAVMLIDSGVKLTNYFTDDITGATRGSTWDVGPYEWFSSQQIATNTINGRPRFGRKI